MYLLQILQKYKEKDLSPHSASIAQLQNILQTWASSCYIEIINSGSRAKGTAIAIASDVDYLISLSSNCNENNGGLRGIYDGVLRQHKDDGRQFSVVRPNGRHGIGENPIMKKLKEWK